MQHSISGVLETISLNGIGNVVILRWIRTKKSLFVSIHLLGLFGILMHTEEVVWLICSLHMNSVERIFVCHREAALDAINALTSLVAVLLVINFDVLKLIHILTAKFLLLTIFLPIILDQEIC
jgi:hypothetical protein